MAQQKGKRPQWKSLKRRREVCDLAICRELNRKRFYRSGEFFSLWNFRRNSDPREVLIIFGYRNDEIVNIVLLLYIIYNM